jgi:hypothetical protein
MKTIRVDEQCFRNKPVNSFRRCSRLVPYALCREYIIHANTASFMFLPHDCITASIINNSSGPFRKFCWLRQGNLFCSTNIVLGQLVVVLFSR